MVGHFPLEEAILVRVQVPQLDIFKFTAKVQKVVICLSHTPFDKGWKILYYLHMKTPDFDRIRCEEQRSISDFCGEYNKDLPESFTRASVSLLAEYRRSHPEAFRMSGTWTLDQHRKKIIDWLPMQAPRTIASGAHLA